MLLSIITPLHNKGAYIAETISSVQGQTLADWEMIVVENHSSDDGPEQVERLASADPRIRLIRAPDAVRGPGAARNMGLSEARGEWVLFLDADDLIVRNHLKSLVEVGQSSGAPVVASDWVEFVDGRWAWDGKSPLDGSVIQSLTRHHAVGSTEPAGRIAVHDSSIAYAPWAVHCALIRRDALDERRRWIEDLDRHPSEDTAFWFRVLWERKVAYTRMTSAIYRTETPNFRNVHRDLDRWIEAMEAIHAENLCFLKSEGTSVNVCQAECLMRVWSKLGADASAQALLSSADHAYKRADHWGSSCSWGAAALAIRKLIGCRRFDRLLLCSRKNIGL